MGKNFIKQTKRHVKRPWGQTGSSLSRASQAREEFGTHSSVTRKPPGNCENGMWETDFGAMLVGRPGEWIAVIQAGDGGGID